MVLDSSAALAASLSAKKVCSLAAAWGLGQADGRSCTHSSGQKPEAHGNPADCRPRASLHSATSKPMARGSQKMA